MKQITLLLLGLLTLNSCDDEPKIDLGDNFYYIPRQESTFDQIGFSGNGIFRYDISPKIPVVLPTIIDYKFDSQYIIVKQSFDEENTEILLNYIRRFSGEYFCLDSSYGYWNEEYYTNTLNEFGFYDDITKDVMDNTRVIQEMKKNKINYFIIDKSTTILSGPFTLQEFEKAKKERNINLSFN